jgi:hypothetical protein
LRAEIKTAPACKGQAGKQEFKMKKKIGSGVKIGLVVLLLTVVAVGSVFAQMKHLGDQIRMERRFNDKTDDQSIGFSMFATLAVQGVNIWYNCVVPPGCKVIFTFTAFYNDGTKPKTWTETENLTKPREKTMNFVLLNQFNIDHIEYSLRRG